MARLTELSIKALKAPGKGAIVHADDQLPGFGIRVSQGGTKTFVLTHGKHRERTTLGRYGIITLQEARDAARRILAEKTLGQHQAKSITFEEAEKLFLAAAERKNKPRTVRDYTRLLKTHFRRFRGTDLSKIETDDLMRVIDKLAPTPTEQNHAFTAVHALLRFCVRRRYLRHSPLEAIPLPAKLATRDRVLTADELKALWPHLKGQFGAIVKLCLLTGQRRSEIGFLKADYIDLDKKTITLPDTATKNRREHVFPFGDMTATVLSELSKYGYVFGGRGYANWSNGKRLLDKDCPLPPWTLHDLRRTFATNLAELGVLPHVVEKMLNHASGTIKGVAAIYNRHRFMDEMRAAVGLWETRLKAILEPQP